MSALVLQRVVVRMLHDPVFRAAVYADPATALGGLPLTADEHRLLRVADARAWAVDVQRSERVLHALIGELPVSVLVLMEEGLTLARLARFFESAFFHDTIMTRGSLAPAFGDYLATLTTRVRTRSVVALEHAIARLRRVTLPAQRPAPGHLQRAAQVRPVALATGTLAAWHKAKQSLGEEPLAALFATSRPRFANVNARTSEWVLLELAPEAPTVPTAAFIGEALGRLLEAAEQPVARAVLEAAAEREGADPVEALEIVADLIVEGLLVEPATACSEGPFAQLRKA